MVEQKLTNNSTSTTQNIIHQHQHHFHHHHHIHHHHHNHNENNSNNGNNQNSFNLLNQNQNQNNIQKYINDLSLDESESLNNINYDSKKPNYNQFRKKIKGKCYMKGDQDYETLCNDRWDQDPINQPTIIVRAISANDVKETINFVREYCLKIAIKTSGHNIVSAIDGGVSLDLSLMKSVVVNERDQTVKVECGCTFHDIDEITSQYGLAMPLGQISSIGVGGFSTGGGLGHLTKPYGLSCDNLVEAEIVTADGLKYRCNSNKNRDLFWAIRGAAGFVGVVTSFTFKCYPVSDIVIGTFTYDISANNTLARDALVQVGTRHLQYPTKDQLVYIININPGATSDSVLIKAVYLDGANNPTLGTQLIQDFQNATNPTTASISVIPFTNLQFEFDGLIMPGKYYQEGPLIKTTITQDVADLILSHMASRIKQTFSSIIITELGGQVNKLSTSDCAFPVRNSTFNIFYTSVLTSDATVNQSIKQWTQNSIKDLSPYTAGHYINTTYLTDMRIVFGSNFTKLRKIKNEHDPDNIFRSLYK
ncbi:hypothetical protein DICPUDRAFT_42712 [Dictyostelium purpureum]|uniref:FAD-binding PCMH-type domain-containing protein n=1 Tax=Dictyostelium purpureum TaxID=5786 RepID=F1A2M5_DICPU|nr:uncharacterized protein DICPUDRAFT_42712 [Dictyostelium purpureum]EGC29549.1 hypothetical protein DICPUDRAFT_42712 [Dictyostelium purpureum]|eukprot:XP_003293919.1 hypothetical protein DICPUDRAFT_42712 [Dictyostelium purpureum]